MKIVCLGGAGAMGSSSVYDLHKANYFDEIIIADTSEDRARKVIDLMDGDSRFSFVKLDASDINSIESTISGADLILDSLPYDFVDNVMEAACRAGVSGVSINMTTDENRLAKYDSRLREKKKTFLLGNGGCATTCMLAVDQAKHFDEIDDIEFFWGMWRPVTYSTVGLAETIIGDGGPFTPDRSYWENGKLFDNIPPFGLSKEFEFPPPIGKQEPYVLPHWEPKTLPLVPLIKEKGSKRIFVRGIWHPTWTRLIRVMLENGIYEAEPVQVKGTSVSVFEVLMSHLHRRYEEAFQDPGEIEKALGFVPQCILSVEIRGYRGGAPKRTVVHCRMPYPFFEGKKTTCPMEYGSYVGLPGSISLQMLSQGQISVHGVMTIENSDASPALFLSELKKRKATFWYREDSGGPGSLSPSEPINAGTSGQPKGH